LPLEKPKLLAEKFTALERASTRNTIKPQERKPGPTVQARAGLAAVYAHAGLPKVKSPDELPEGEQRMLKERRLHDFVGELYAPAPMRPGTRTKTQMKQGRPRGRQR
jgi:hypothetical protein